MTATTTDLPALSEEECANLRKAYDLLEHPNLAIRLTNLIGVPTQKGVDYLPANWRDKLTNFSKDALLTTMERIVLPTLDSGSSAISNMQPLIEPDSGDWLRKIKAVASGNWFHRILATLTGAGGGALGFVALPVELPITTGLFLRSIMDVARREGANLNDPETLLQCMNVFALGGDSERDDQANEGYYAVRLALS